MSRLWFPRNVLIKMTAKRAGLYNREKGKNTGVYKLVVCKEFTSVYFKITQLIVLDSLY